MQRATGHAGRGRNLVDARRVEALDLEQLERRIENACANAGWVVLAPRFGPGRGALLCHLEKTDLRPVLPG
jgi:hypothetical protein